MHSRNLYRTSPDFSALADFFPPLKPYVSGRHLIDFTDPEAQRVLTKALLKRDFDLILLLPENRLCPPVPNRLNYVLWIQDILQDIEPVHHIRGLDIGTGASAIYPLIACSSPKAEHWTFVGTEIDPISASFASRNVEANNLQSRISILDISGTEETSILLPLIQDPHSRFDFTMCNPPFYGSLSEIEASAEGKDLPPNAACTGSDGEMITPGGETAFVLQILRESAREDVRNRCRWFTSMLGKLSSVGQVVRELHNLGIDNYALTQFIQGTTRRWAVAWSFQDDRLPDMVARPLSSSLSPHLPAPTTLHQAFPVPVPFKIPSPKLDSQPIHDIKSTLVQVLTSIKGVEFRDCPTVSENGSPSHDGPWTIDVMTSENTWSRAARRKRKRSPSPSTEHVGKAPRLDSTPQQNPGQVTRTTATEFYVPRCPELVCRISALPALPEPNTHSVTLRVQWRKGKDRALFEGFWSHVCRKVTERLRAAGDTEG